jgi:drug/metabolite transporter (DMT)-like permease
MISTANRRIGIPLVLLAGVFWSTSGILYRLIQEATPWHVLRYRSVALLLA